MKTCLIAIAAAAAAAAVPAAAQSGADDILSKVINLPLPAAHRVDGTRGSIRNDKAVQGGKALRIDVPRKGADAWEISVSNPIEKPVKAGDLLVLAFWARLEKGENGAATATLPYNAVQFAQAPYTPLFSGPVTIGSEWQLHELKGKADKDYPAGALNVAIHLATGKQTVDIGPMFVLDLGQ